ncbi:MAG: M14 family metallopeptidase [Bacteriovoracales bacterium]|nr:M14 family metallopeptidase [Bacteriovoracales bacterium]
MKVFLTIWCLHLNFTLLAEDSYHFVHLQAEGAQERSQIADYIHIDRIIEDDVYATVNSFDLNILKTFLPDKIVTSHSLDFPYDADPTESDVYEFPKVDHAYHTYNDVLDVIDSLSREYPQIVEVFTLGKTVEGYDIPLIRITHKKNRASDFFVPGILFVGSHHAREHLSTEIPLMLARHLAENYEFDESIRELVNSRDIYIVPVLNVDGKLHDIKGRRYKWWRKNRSFNEGTSARGVDLNRNYSYNWGGRGSSKRPRSETYRGPAPFSEPETQAIKNFIETTHNIRILLSYHTYSELILYPWSSSFDGVGGMDQQIFETMAQDMSRWNNYAPQQSSELYLHSGGTCDWAYGIHNIYCFSFELSPSPWGMRVGFYPGNDIIEPTFQINLGPALYLMEYSDNPSRVLAK